MPKERSKATGRRNRAQPLQGSAGGGSVAAIGSRILGTVRVPKTAELIADQLRRQIVRGELRSGEGLPSEGDLMAQFGVSRPTLREAFRVLESESLITVRRGAHGGAKVNTPSGEMAARYTGLVLEYQETTLADVYEARAILEPQAVAAIAAKRDPEVIAALRRELENPSEDEGGLHTGASFHLRLVELAGNKTLTLLAAMVDRIFELHSTMAAMGDQSVSGKAIEEARRAHERVMQLIERGAVREAEAFWKEHVEGSNRYLLSSIGAKTILDLLG